MNRAEPPFVHVLHRLGCNELSLGIMSPVALYDVWLSRERLSAKSLAVSPCEDLQLAIARLDELLREPSAIVADSIWHANELERGRQKIMHLLVSRRREAVDRLADLEIDRVSRSATEITQKQMPPALRRHADRATDSLTEDVAALRRRLDQVERAALGNATQEDRLFDVEVMERRWEVLGRVLTRDYVATIVGGVLLIGLAAALVCAMFMDKPVSDIVSNSFLIVTGYFFGQSVGSRSGEPGSLPVLSHRNNPPQRSSPADRRRSSW